MDFKLIDKFKTLHDEIIHIIINYTGVITYRNGKFMNQLKKDDSRFVLLQKIRIPILIGSKFFYKSKCSFFSYRKGWI